MTGSISKSLAAPPDAAANSQSYQPEQMQDPYVPGPGVSSSNPHLTPSTPAGSVQVNVDANGNNIVGDAANEPSIVIDPTNPQHIVIAWRQFDTISSNFRQAGHAYSTNGGLTWTFPGSLDPGVFRSDPVLAADSAGRIFYDSLKNDFCMDVFQSTDGGATWPTMVAAFGGDKEWLAVDRTGGVGDGNLYAAWQNGAICTGSGLFTRSTNHGATWMTPIAVSGSPRFGVTAVGPDGTVYVAGISPTTQSTFIVAKSTTVQNPLLTPSFTSVSGNLLGGAMVINAGPNPGGLLGQAWIAANPNIPTHVYLLCSVDPPGSDPLDVRFARSLDAGAHWSIPVRVNDDSTSNNAWQWFGTMSVAPNGRIDVVWNDTRDDPANQLSRLYYSSSTDEGATWSANIPLTPQWNSQVGFPNQNKIGDYYHMISDNTGASLAYSATFNGEEDVYFMRITATCIAPVVNPISNANATCGVAFTSPAPGTSAGSTPLTWSLGGSPPAGMTINSATGVVSWPSPVTTGSPFTITTTATNTCGNNSQNWTLTVAANPPTINSIANAFATCGVPYASPAPTTTNGVAPISWSLIAGPAGMTIDTSTGIVSWPSPTAIGSPFTVTLQASSAGGCGISAPQSWQLGVVIGDFDGDGLVTINDITGLVNDLISASPTCAGDLNGDGNVDGLDIQAFDTVLGL